MEPASLTVPQKVRALVKALNGATRTNEALARCKDSEAMLDVLVDASRRLGLGLSRADLLATPPIRDWIWWKNKEALLTIGDNLPRYRQDGRQAPSATPAPGEGSRTPTAGATEPEPRRRFFGLF